MNSSWKSDHGRAQLWTSRSQDLTAVEIFLWDYVFVWPLQMELDELKYRICESNASTEQEMVWEEFLYCVDVVKLPLKFILSIYEVKN